MTVPPRTNALGRRKWRVLRDGALGSALLYDRRKLTAVHEPAYERVDPLGGLRAASDRLSVEHDLGDAEGAVDWTPTATYGDSAYPCEFEHIVRELEAMAPTWVRADGATRSIRWLSRLAVYSTG